jgi:hypothetical protein
MFVIQEKINKLDQAINYFKDLTGMAWHLALTTEE